MGMVSLPLSDRRNRVMWLNNDRVFYAGLLGAVSVRTMGGWLVYASLGAPLRIALEDADAGIAAADAPWQTAQLDVVPPWVPHQEINASPDEMLECVLCRSDGQAVAVNLDIEPAERPQTVLWVDPTHPYGGV